MKPKASSTDRAKERRKLAEYFARQIERKFCPLPPATRQLVIQAFETGYKTGQMGPSK